MVVPPPNPPPPLAIPPDPSPGPLEGEEDSAPQPIRMVNPESLGAGNVPSRIRELAAIPPRHVERGVVAFDLDGTLLDDIKLVSHVAGEVLHRAFGTPPEEGRIHYLATTGMPFEAQLAQLYPDAPLELRSETARNFHQRKVREAYAYAHPFPEVPRLLKRLEQERWTLVVSTGAEREMAELLLEREGIRIWFEDVLGSGQGTKREHLGELRRRFPGVPIFLVGDSRFDLEAARDSEVGMFARASLVPGWTITPEDFRSWGARWADYSLSGLPEALNAPAPRRRAKRGARAKPTARRRRSVGRGKRRPTPRADRRVRRR
jgi:phosphoglycolate phosphatase-like HAD superfamily hydrolase